MRLIWRAAALHDLEAIISYIAERNRPGAERLQAAIEHHAERLNDHPYLHRLGRVPGTREAIVHPNYILVYRVGEEQVEVIAVVHARQRYP